MMGDPSSERADPHVFKKVSPIFVAQILSEILTLKCCAKFFRTPVIVKTNYHLDLPQFVWNLPKKSFGRYIKLGWLLLLCSTVSFKQGFTVYRYYLQVQNVRISQKMFQIEKNVQLVSTWTKIN